MRNSWVMALRFSLAAGLFCALSCSDRERLSVEDDGQPDLTEVTITSEGGVLETEGFRLVVPPGAFLEPATLKVTDVTAQAPENPHRATPVFRVIGLPETIVLPCSLQIVMPGDPPPDGEYAILIEETDTWVDSGADFRRCGVTLAASAGETGLSALLPATPSEKSTPTPAHPFVDTAEGTLDVSGTSGIKRDVSAEGHFHFITYNSGLQGTVAQLGTLLESAYSKLRDDLQLSWAKRTRPIQVTIQPFSTADTEKWGLHSPSKWYGADYDEILLNETKVMASPGSQELAVTVGHELFHLMQHLYDPRYRILQGAPNEWYWMNEAMSTWFERKMAGTQYVTQSVVEADYRFLCSHSLQYSPTLTAAGSCTDCWLVQNHGYGASLFLGATFEGVTGGDRRIGDVLKLRLESRNPLNAVNEVVSQYTAGFEAIWRSFCYAWMDGAIYQDVPSFPHPDKIVEGRNATYAFSSPTDSGTTFSWYATDWTAHVYTVFFAEGAAFPQGSSLSVSLMDEEGGCQVLAYEYKRGQMWSRYGSITQSGHEMVVPRLDEWAADGKALVLMVNRSQGSQTNYVPTTITVTARRCEPDLPVVLNGIDIPESKVVRSSGGCVTEIDLRDMNLTDLNCLQGIEYYAGELKKLNLYGGSFSGPGNHLDLINLSWLRVCKRLQSLDLGYLGLDAVDLGPLSGCTDLRGLYLSGNSLVSLDLNPLSSCKQLRQLWATDNSIGGLDLGPLAECDSLEYLILRRNPLGQIDLTPLGSVPNLRNLEFNECGLDALDLTPLATCTRLIFLAAGTNNLDTIDLTPLASCPRLDIVAFNSNSLDHVSLAPLGNCLRLRSINFGDNDLVSIDLAPLQTCTNLTWLDLPDNDLNSINLTPIMAHNSMQDLNVLNNNLDVNSCGQVCAFRTAHPYCHVQTDCGCRK
ncbi:MAG: hypothetical protein KJ970_13465 [Candidatus Eisenbacteria bacterium]|uniref:Leucine-rich repeat domain-containing protein n=1 Tax=Eiseniibacteriota bacterium TaxID=2212470 RepID=A0A948RVR7_UNCEI|nr:hypothetical protein [Candidatus Eisenbacteria bacterium]MBU1949533.1 hypothetical protein [Candidatus Eisenbacteria bacterium]MBU2691923.1 hypothetical protein [Candidatus Eisenbacteria bacterium]